MVPHFESPPASPDSFSRPRPRPPRSPGHSAQIRAQNRRRAYLDSHPDYFQSFDHELADPLLYDFLIRRFQTPAEREADGRAKGYARVLEGSLLRGEERLAKLRAAQPVGSQQRQWLQRRLNGDGGGGGVVMDDMDAEEDKEDADAEEDGDSSPSGSGNGGFDGGGVPRARVTADDEAEAGTTFSSLNAELTPPPKTREEGRAQWVEFLRDRFIRGEDEDFDYAAVDGDEGYDVLEREDREEAWFEEEEPEWASDGGGTSDEGEGEGGGGGKAERVLKGETGIQDF